MTEQNIIEKLKKHEEGALEELQLHSGPLIRYVIRPILPDERDREECFQDVLLIIWQRIQSFDGDKGTWNAWLTAIARNTALNRRRSLEKGERLELSEETADDRPSPEEEMLQKERQAALLKVLAKLKHSDRILFYRKYYYCQSVRQIAAEIGTTERAVEGRLYRIKRSLRGLLEGEGHGKA